MLVGRRGEQEGTATQTAAAAAKNQRHDTSLRE